MKTDNVFVLQQGKIKKVWEGIASHKRLFLYSYLFDLLFFFLAGVVNATLVQKLTTIMYTIGGLLSKASLNNPNQSTISGMISQAGAWNELITFGILFLVWIL